MKIPDKKPDLSTWITSNSNMIIQRIGNFISPSLQIIVGYANCNKEMWDNITDKYGALIYQVQRDMSNITKGNDSLTTYCAKMKKLDDELMCLAPIPKIKAEMEKYLDRINMIQFLVGLGDAYDSAKSQVLMLFHFPPGARLGMETGRVWAGYNHTRYPTQ